MDELQQRLLRLAGRFYTEAESPSEEDMETIFVCLLKRDIATLNDMVRSFGICTEEEN